MRVFGDGVLRAVGGGGRGVRGVPFSVGHDRLLLPVKYKMDHSFLKTCVSHHCNGGGIFFFPEISER